MIYNSYLVSAYLDFVAAIADRRFVTVAFRSLQLLPVYSKVRCYYGSIECASKFLVSLGPGCTQFVFCGNTILIVFYLVT